MSDLVEPEVVSAILVREGRLFLQQRPKGKDFAYAWESPGGKVEAGESHRFGLVREVREETDLVCRGVDHAAVWTGLFDSPVSRPDRSVVRVTFYRVTEVVGMVIAREGHGWGWFSEAEVWSLDGAGVLSPANKRALGAVMKSAFGVGFDVMRGGPPR